MATMDFSQAAAAPAAPVIDAKATIVTDTPAAQVPAVANSERAIATPEQLLAGGAIVGEFSDRDTVRPYLTLIQKQTKKYPKHAKPGNFLFDKEYVVGAGEGEEDMSIVVVRMVRSYEEHNEFGESDDYPTVFAKLEQAKAAGFDYNNPIGAKKIRDRADLLVLIKMPAKFKGTPNEVKFPYQYEGERYATAQWTVRGGSYKKVAKQVYTSIKPGGFCAGDPTLWTWNVSVTEESSPKSTWFEPLMKPGTATTPEFRAFIVQII